MPVPHTPRFVTGSELARMRGVSRQAVSAAGRPGGPLSRVRDSRGRYDAAHPDTLAWLSEGDGAPTVPPSGEAATASEMRQARLSKLRAEAARLELRIAVEQGELISRELVRAHVFGALEALAKRLLRDVPMSLAVRVAAVEQPEEREKIIRETISDQIRAAKEQVARTLRGAVWRRSPVARADRADA